MRWNSQEITAITEKDHLHIHHAPDILPLHRIVGHLPIQGKVLQAQEPPPDPQDLQRRAHTDMKDSLIAQAMEMRHHSPETAKKNKSPQKRKILF